MWFLKAERNHKIYGVLVHSLTTTCINSYFHFIIQTLPPTVTRHENIFIFEKINGLENQLWVFKSISLMINMTHKNSSYTCSLSIMLPLWNNVNKFCYYLSIWKLKRVFTILTLFCLYFFKNRWNWKIHNYPYKIWTTENE